MLERVALACYVALFAVTVRAQQQCYYGAGAQFRGPTNLVPCNSTGASACCLLGDTCLSGNACYDPVIGNVYQYGCTDVTYSDESCPYKCGFDPGKSPWTALEYCSDIEGLSDTWVCHGPESCGCEWQSTYDILVLQPRGCKAMGSDALVALHAPSTLAPYVSLPSTFAGSTAYYSRIINDGTSSWVDTAISGYTPADFTQFTTYTDIPRTSEWVSRNALPGPATYAPAASFTGPAPIPTNTPQSTDTQSLQTQSTLLQSTSSTTGSGSSMITQSTPDSSTGVTRSAPTLSLGSETPIVETSAASTSDLSTGAKAGIGVGVALGVLIIASLLIALLLMRRRHRKQMNEEQRYSAIATQPYDPQSPGLTLQSPALGKEPYMGYQPDEGAGHDFSLKKPDLSAWSLPPTELAADPGHTIHELESATPELSARPSVRASPRPLSNMSGNNLL